MTMSYLFKNLNITWSNICEILKLKNLNEIEYYLNLSNELCFTARELCTRIKSNDEIKIKNDITNYEQVSECLGGLK